LWRGNSNGKEYANVCHPHFSIHYGLFNLLSICGQSLACPDSERGNNASWSRNTDPDPDRRHRHPRRRWPVGGGAADAADVAASVASGAWTTVIGAVARC